MIPLYCSCLNLWKFHLQIPDGKVDFVSYKPTSVHDVEFGEKQNKNEKKKGKTHLGIYSNSGISFSSPHTRISPSAAVETRCLRSLRPYVMVRGLLGGGGGMSSVSGSRWCFRVCPWEAAVHLSMNSNSISFVTGFWMLLHTAMAVL